MPARRVLTFALLMIALLATGRGETEASSFDINAGLDYAFYNYDDGSVSGYTERAFAAKAELSYPALPADWFFKGSASCTLFPITERDGITARLFDLRSRIGYRLPSLPDPWGLSVSGGYFYSALFVDGNAFGFHGANGPLISPELSRKLSDGNSFSIYASLGAALGTGSGSILDNRLIAGGGAINLSLEDGHHLAVTLDISSLRLALPSDGVASRSVSIGCEYSLL